MRLGVQYPIHAGGYAAAYNASAVNDTDWHSLSSDDFYDTRTGTQLPSGLSSLLSRWSQDQPTQ